MFGESQSDGIVTGPAEHEFQSYNEVQNYNAKPSLRGMNVFDAVSVALRIFPPTKYTHLSTQCVALRVQMMNSKRPATTSQNTLQFWTGMNRTAYFLATRTFRVLLFEEAVEAVLSLSLHGSLTMT